MELLLWSRLEIFFEIQKRKNALKVQSNFYCDRNTYVASIFAYWRRKMKKNFFICNGVSGRDSFQKNSPPVHEDFYV